MTSNILYRLCGLLICAPAFAPAFAATIPDYPFVFVVGKANIDTPPNIATCTLTVRSIDQDAGKAESIVDARLKSVLATLTAKRVSANDIESFNINKQILTNENLRNENNEKPAIIRGYDVSRSVKFTARQLDSLPAIESTLVGSPNIENINCQFDRTDRAAVEADLLTKAIHSARSQADKLAEPLGRHVTAAQAISRSPLDTIAGSFGLGGGFAGSEYTNRMFKKSVSADELLVPSTIPMSATVNVLFKIE